VHESWTAPTILMDATMPAEIVKQFFPVVEVPSRISAPMPHTRVRQITDRPMAAHMLIPDGDPNDHPNPTRRANIERVRRFLFVRAAEVSPGRVLVVCQQGLEVALRTGPLPTTVEVAHFNAITGLNAWNDVALVVVIGRIEPAVRDIERIARVLFGAEVAEVEPDDRNNIRYPRVRRGIRMRDGRAIAVEGSCHPDPRVEAVRLAICESELVQAIGRGRGVNRTEANPLQIDILTNVCLPIVVDETTTWERIQPTSIEVMIANGAIPVGYSDMAAAYPDLYPSAEGARKRISRENPGQTSMKVILYRRMSGVSSVGYRRTGARGPAGTLLYDPARIDPQTWLIERLGPVKVWDQQS
jgi:putative DNA primase/helicase